MNTTAAQAQTSHKVAQYRYIWSLSKYTGDHALGGKMLEFQNLCSKYANYKLLSCLLSLRPTLCISLFTYSVMLKEHLTSHKNPHKISSILPILTNTIMTLRWW